MFAPVSEKIFVLASRRYRFNAGSRNEFILMVCLGMLAWSGGYIGTMGGMRGLLAAFIGSYDLAKSRYEVEGTKICYGW